MSLNTAPKLSLKPAELAFLFINNELIASRSKKRFATYNPATEEVITEVYEALAEDIDDAVNAARTALPIWKRVAPKERGALLWRIADEIEAHNESLAHLEMLDNGKPLKDALAIDIVETVDCFRYFAGWADKVCGEVAQMPSEYHAYTVREPVGVVGLIIPWNYPLLMAAWKVAPALACGNTVILKPAEQTPLSAVALGLLARRVGLPAGVLNILPGYGERAGHALTHHPAINKVAFTGSGEVGRIVLRASSHSNLKRVTLELGGKSANVVMDDADLDAAVEGAYGAIFANMGQNCVAGSRLLLHTAIHDAFVQKLIAYTKANTRIGAGDDPEANFGPLIERAAMERSLTAIAKAKNEGARVVYGGERVGTRGYFVAPTIIVDVKASSNLSCEEVFGPVLAVQRVKSLDEAIEVANASDYGLGAAIWTKNIDNAHKFCREVLAGTVWVNTYNMNPANLPFGGFKQSGFGRDLGREAINHYTEVKTVTWKLAAL